VFSITQPAYPTRWVAYPTSWVNVQMSTHPVYNFLTHFLHCKEKSDEQIVKSGGLSIIANQNDKGETS
jgi:hypothetical protein